MASKSKGALQKEQRRKERNKMIFTMLSELDLEKLLDLMIDKIPQVVGAEGCSVFLRNEAYGDFELRRTTGLIDAPKGRIAYKEGEGLTGWICKHGKPLRIRSVMDKKELAKIAPALKWAKKYSEARASTGHAFLGLPLISSKGAVLGAIRLSPKSSTAPFTKLDEDLVLSIASKVAFAIENATLYHSEKRRRECLELLAKIGIELSKILDIRKLLKTVVERAAKTFSAETCEIHLRDEADPNRLVMRAAYGVPDHLIDRAEHAVGEGVTGWIVEKGQTVRTKNVMELPQYKGKYREQILSRVKRRERKVLLGMPLKSSDRVVGVIKLYHEAPIGNEPRYFTEEDQQYLEILADEIAVAIENTSYLQSLRDVAVKALRMQRLTSLGTLALRLPSKVENSLATARMAVDNLSRAISSRFSKDTELSKWLKERLGNIRQPLKEVDENIDLLRDYSTKAGFVRSSLSWPNLLDESLLLVKGSIITRRVDVKREPDKEKTLPSVFVEPTEVMEVVTTILQILLHRMRHYGGRMTIKSELSRDQNYLKLTFHGADGDERFPMKRDALVGGEIMHDYRHPFRFALDVAQNIIETEYGGRLAYETKGEKESLFILDMRMRKGWTK